MKRIITDEDRDWLKENYPHLTNKTCLQHLKIGFKTLKALVAECGLEYKCGTHANTKEKLKSNWKEDDINIGYCIDCSRYVIGGSCGRTGKCVGALWKKKCFEQ